MVFDSTKRWKVPSIAIVVVLAILSIGLLVSPAGADGTVLPGNQNCAQLIPGSRELRVDPAAEGTFTDNTLTVVIDIRTLTADDPNHGGDQTGSQVFDFTATGGTVLGVAVKGGSNTNFYNYQPNGVTSGTGLHAPVGPGGKFSGLSHISFCYVVKANPTIATQVKKTSDNSNVPNNGTISIGTSVYDTATLTGATSDAGGTVTYKLFTDNTCTTLSAAPALNQTVNVTNGVVPNSNGVTFNAAGTWYFQATYSGDNNNNGPVSSACTSEVVVVAKNTPAIATQPAVQIKDSVTVTGLTSNATGTVTIRLFDPSNATCDDTLPGTFTDVVKTIGTDGTFVPATGTYTVDTAFVAATDGIWRYVVSYSGDANNDPQTTACGAESVNIDITP
jgi:hypothetical protein